MGERSPTITGCDMTRLEVANAAINLLGGVVMSTWGESTQAGTLASLHLPFALKQVLSEAPWEDIVQVLQLDEADLVDKVYGNMTYAYALPGDLFRIFEVNGLKTGWKMVDGVLHVNDPNPDILYGVEPADDTIPSEVGHLTALLLAYYLAPSLTQDPNKAGQMLQQYAMILANEKLRTEQQLGDIDDSPGWWTD